MTITTHRSGGRGDDGQRHRPGVCAGGVRRAAGGRGQWARSIAHARPSRRAWLSSSRKGRLTATERDGALQRLSTGTNVDLLADSDYVVEAIFEDKQAKQSLFARLDQLTRPDVILASNTSSISITTLGAATNRPDRVLGMHFMNPVPLMSLVELIRGQATSPESMLTAAELCIRLNKTAVEASDYPGFIANRVLMPMMNEAIFAVMEGVGTAGCNRYGHEARDEPPDGPADARRFHRPRRLPGDPGGPPRRSGRSEVPAVPAPAADGCRRSSRPEVGPGLLPLLILCCRPTRRRGDSRWSAGRWPLFSAASPCGGCRRTSSSCRSWPRPIATRRWRYSGHARCRPCSSSWVWPSRLARCCCVRACSSRVAPNVRLGQLATRSQSAGFVLAAVPLMLISVVFWLLARA